MIPRVAAKVLGLYVALAICAQASRIPVIRRDLVKGVYVDTAADLNGQGSKDPKSGLSTTYPNNNAKKADMMGVGPEIQNGNGRGNGGDLYPPTNALYLALDSKPKSKCMYDMNTFVESNLNYGTDGGLYAEMIRNRAFQDGADSVFRGGDKDTIGSGSLSGWQAGGNAALDLVPDHPLSSALPNSAKVQCGDKTKAGTFGIKNLGFFGMPVSKDSTYTASFFIRGDAAKKFNIRIGLYSNDLTQTWAEQTTYFPVSSEWQNVTVQLKPTKDATDLNNVFAILADCVDVAEFQVNLVTLFPPTFEGTVARKDLADELLAFKAKAIRWPGGNDLVGATINSRFQWNNTLGPLQDRPGRLGNWHGWNTDGLGVVEMYNFISKVGARLIVGLWAGVDANAHSVPVKDLGPYIKQQVDFAHFLLDTTGPFQEMRVKNGGPATPYDVQAFLIGNEGQSTPSVDYQVRFDMIVAALKKDFASHKGFDEIDLIASAPITVPTGYKYKVDLLNLPLYGTPADFVQRYHMYDTASRTNNTVFYNMEFSVINSGMEASDDVWNGPGRLHHSIMQGSLAEAVLILGMENNCDIVRGSAYAPELANESDDNAVQSTPGLLEFDTTKVVGSTSWLVQKTFGQHRLSQNIAIDKTTVQDLESHQVYTSAGFDADNNLVVKLVNYNEHPVDIVINTAKDPKTFDCAIVAGDGPLSSNTLQKQEVSVKNDCGTATLNAGSLKATLKKWSFTVYTIHSK